MSFILVFVGVVYVCLFCLMEWCFGWVVFNVVTIEVVLFVWVWGGFCDWFEFGVCFAIGLGLVFVGGC